MNKLLIGGTGLLGRHLLYEMQALTPTRKQLDITKPDTIEDYLINSCADAQIEDIILAAAFTDTVASNYSHQNVYDININGPRNLIRIINKLNKMPRIVYISSDYVFNGDSGNYAVTEPTCPVSNNYYAYSKAVAEEIIRTYENHLIIRTSFCMADKWLHSKAFIDKFTSADKVTTIAPLIFKYMTAKENGIIHVGTKRKSVFELAKTINPNVLPCYRSDVLNIKMPYDTSLELTKL